MRLISIIVATAVYLLVGCAPSASQKSQGIRTVKTRAPEFKPNSQNGKIGKNGKTRRVNKSAVDTATDANADSETSDQDPSNSSVPRPLKSKIENLITFIHEESPSFARQLRWSVKQNRSFPADISSLSEARQIEEVLTALLGTLSGLEEDSRELCESYKTVGSECASLESHPPQGAKSIKNARLEVAKILIQKDRNSIQADNLANLLSSISIEAPYLKEISYQGSDIRAAAQKLDGQSLKFRPSASKKICRFQVTPQSMKISVVGENNSSSPEQNFEVSLDSIDDHQKDQIVVDEASTLALYWAPEKDAKAALMTRQLDAKSAVTGFYYKNKDKEIRCLQDTPTSEGEKKGAL